MRWLFWDVDFDALDGETQADAILARVLEEGRLEDVRALLDLYGRDRIHTFFRDVGHPLIGARTRAFWRAFFAAEDESWAMPSRLSDSQQRALGRLSRLEGDQAVGPGQLRPRGGARGDGRRASSPL